MGCLAEAEVPIITICIIEGVSATQALTFAVLRNNGNRES
jgi:hypothetical protein